MYRKHNTNRTLAYRIINYENNDSEYEYLLKTN